MQVKNQGYVSGGFIGAKFFSDFRHYNYNYPLFRFYPLAVRDKIQDFGATLLLRHLQHKTILR